MIKLSYKFIILSICIIVFISALSFGKDEKQKQLFEQNRYEMVRRQIEARGIQNPLVLDAMRKVERHLFVHDSLSEYAYYDGPLPIDAGQTISQPYIVAYMSEALMLDKNSKVLEIGTGSGYQAAVLGEICDSVFSIEIIKLLADKSDSLLKSLGYKNIVVKHGDGYIGWEEYAPFDAIIVTAAPPFIPQPLLDQLADGGRMIIPVGTSNQQLILFKKLNNTITEEKLLPVRFVPMTGKAQENK